MFVGSVCDRLFPERVTDPPYIRTRRPLWKRHQCRFLKVLHVCRVGLRPTLSRAGHRPALHQNKTTFMETALEHDNKQRVGIFSRPFSISPTSVGGQKGGVSSVIPDTARSSSLARGRPESLPSLVTPISPPIHGGTKGGSHRTSFREHAQPPEQPQHGDQRGNPRLRKH